MDYVDGIIQATCGQGIVLNDFGIRSSMWTIAKQNREVLGKLILGAPPVLGADVLVFEDGHTMNHIHSMIRINLGFPGIGMVSV
jgi:hypothetical protein